jgi:hypothetical protein
MHLSDENLEVNVLRLVQGSLNLLYQLGASAEENFCSSLSPYGETSGPCLLRRMKMIKMPA